MKRVKTANGLSFTLNDGNDNQELCFLAKKFNKSLQSHIDIFECVMAKSHYPIFDWKHQYNEDLDVNIITV